MMSAIRTVLCLFALVIVAACASTKVTQQTPMSSRGLARPNQIWVYNFVAAPAYMPTDSSIGGQMSAPSTPPSAEEIETGRKYGAQITQQLVVDIQAMGLPAVQAGPGSRPQVGDCVIRGYIVSAQGGGAVKRFIIGFGAGTTKMDTVVEGYAVTPQGWRKRGDTAGLAQTRLGNADLFRRQNAGDRNAGRSRDRHRESDRADRGRRL
jgi:hypothetical protein